MVTRVHGFTLIELLVAMTLLSMVILIGSSAFGIFGQRWDGQLGRFDSHMRDAKNMMIVQDVLNSLIPYVAYDDRGRPFIYFEGNRNGFVAVSSKSIYSHGEFAVVRLSARQNPDLSFDIIYEEWPMSENILLSTLQPLDFSRPLVLFASVQSPLFEYFGWSDISDRLSADDGFVAPAAKWSPSYNGVVARFAPIKARLSFSALAGNYQIWSFLASENPGLLSRYKSQLYPLGSASMGSSNLDLDHKESQYDDNCDC